MERTIKEVFDEHLSHLKFDQRLLNELYRFQIGFVNKNEEHMAFFGGKLLGVQVVRFTEQDNFKFFNDILNADNVLIKSEIIRDVKDINENFKVSSDILNLTLFYLMYRFLNSPFLDNNKRDDGARQCALIFNYRWIAAFIRDYFKFPADQKLAQTTYANLSSRFLIKKLGSWQEVMDYRSKEIIHGEGIHRDTLLKFDNDLGIIYAINDSQGRIRDMVKNIYSEMVKTQHSGERINVSSGTIIDADGQEVIKDRIHGLENYTSYILNILPDRNSFIKQELISVVVKVMHTMQERGFEKLLEWMSEHYNKEPEIEEIVRKVLIHSFNFLIENGQVLKNTKDLAGLLTKLKGIYVSSRSNEKSLLELRDLGSALIEKAINKTNEQTVAAIRTGLFLYICLRTYTKHHYGG